MADAVIDSSLGVADECAARVRRPVTREGVHADRRRVEGELLARFLEPEGPFDIEGACGKGAERGQRELERGPGARPAVGHRTAQKLMGVDADGRHGRSVIGARDRREHEAA